VVAAAVLAAAVAGGSVVAAVVVMVAVVVVTTNGWKQFTLEQYCACLHCPHESSLSSALAGGLRQWLHASAVEAVRICLCLKMGKLMVFLSASLLGISYAIRYLTRVEEQGWSTSTSHGRQAMMWAKKNVSQKKNE
jgi:hypothetical protein